MIKDNWHNHSGDNVQYTATLMPSYIFAINWVITYRMQNLWKLPNFSTKLDEAYTYGKSSDEITVTTKADDSKQNMCLLGVFPKLFWINLRNWTRTTLDEAYTYPGKSSDELTVTTKADDSKQNMCLLGFFPPSFIGSI